MEQNKNENKEEQVKSARSDAPQRNRSKNKAELVKEKRLYLYTAISCAVALAAIVVIAIATAGEVQGGTQTNQSASDVFQPGNSSMDQAEQPEQPTVTVPEGMISPVETVNVKSDYGFYYNQTLNVYHEHAGLDFSAAAGTSVFAAEDGVVESIYKEDLLLGTEIVILHDDGLRSVYRFVTETEGLKVGAKVKKGDVIATIAEATGNEYKDGAHLHFEIRKDGVCVDPTEYLTLEEK